jgi:cation diffusion facilitator family transporter
MTVELGKIGKLKKGQKVARTAFYLEGILVIAKTVVGLLSGSLVLVSDAVHSASDILSIITSWLGLKIAQKEPDEKFHYGYYKAENLGTLVVSFLILYASWKMFTQGYSGLFSFSQIRIPLLALAVSSLDALLLFFFGNYEIRVGRQINAQSLIAMGEENKTHLFSSSAVFVGILAAYYHIPYIEGLITIVISFLILKIGLTAFKNSIFSLMDIGPGKEIKQKVIKAVSSVPGIEVGETKIGVRKSIDVKRAHEMADKVEEQIKRRVPQIESFMVHIEPSRSDWHHLVIPVTASKGLGSEISNQFSRAPYFLFINLKREKIVGFYVLKNPHKKKEVKVGLATAKLITKQKSDILITRRIGEIAFYVLRDNLFDIYQTEDKTVKRAIKSFLKGEFKQLRKASKSF